MQSWEQLAGRARGGDVAAVNTLLRRVWPYLCKLAQSFRGADPDDLAQCALMKLWRALGRYDNSRPFLPWARVLALNTMRREAKRAGTVPGFEDGFGMRVADRPPYEPDTDGLPDWWVEECIAGLDDTDRAIVGERFGLVGSAALTGASSARRRTVSRQSVSGGLSEALRSMRVAFEVRYGVPA